ncbi:AAA family ATPase [Paenibacillus chartarius]|uniref:AAA family ATPase n=1 Tax=Paenibacillus chartarius TaxID=747481 RepID=A0ABV6DVK3_9BACL
MSTTTASTDLTSKLQKVISVLEQRFLEREELIRLLLLGIASGENVLMVGPPGTAKSGLAHTVAQLFGGGGRFFDYLLTRFTTPDEMFGPVSLQQLKQDEFVRRTEGYLPSAEFAFLDEIFKANSAILNALLSILNERVFFNGREKQQVPLVFLMAASNELPEENEQLAALYDRFLFRYEVSYMKTIASYERMFDTPKEPVPALLSVRDLKDIQRRAEGVELSEAIIYMLFQLKTVMEEKEYVVSDRRWKKIGNVWRTSAALNGRTSVSVWDTVYTPHMLWDFPEDLSPLKELFDGVFQEALKREMERELPLGQYDQVLRKWLEREDELHSFQFKREVGANVPKETAERLRRALDESRAELEETARALAKRLTAWQLREQKLDDWIRSQNVLILHADTYAAKFTRLRIQGERILQQLQGLYRTLNDKDIPGFTYDYTL